jgi:hypothetical protein
LRAQSSYFEAMLFTRWTQLTLFGPDGFDLKFIEVDLIFNRAEAYTYLKVDVREPIQP